MNAVNLRNNLRLPYQTELYLINIYFPGFNGFKHIDVSKNFVSCCVNG